MTNPAYYINFSDFDGCEGHAIFDDIDSAVDFFDEMSGEDYIAYASLHDSEGCTLSEHFSDEDGDTDFEDSEELARLMENPGFAAMMEDADCEDFVG